MRGTRMSGVIVRRLAGRRPGRSIRRDPLGSGSFPADLIDTGDMPVSLPWLGRLIADDRHHDALSARVRALGQIAGESNQPGGCQRRASRPRASRAANMR
jgi:hypothetical protein